MKNFHDIYPNKFNNKTNGITHRRWLLYSNPQLSNLLEKTIGPDFKANPERLQDLMKYVDDKDLQKEFMDVKMERKKILAAYIKETLHIDIDVNSIFDVQAKRCLLYTSNELLEKYPELQGKYVILYTPTFRGNIIKGLRHVDLDLSSLIEKLPDHYVVMYKTVSYTHLICAKEFFNHGCMLLIAFVTLAIHGFFPNIYWFGLLYYALCAFAFVEAVSLILSVLTMLWLSLIHI